MTALSIVAVIAALTVPTFLTSTKQVTAARDQAGLVNLANNALAIAKQHYRALPTASDIQTAIAEMPASSLAGSTTVANPNGSVLPSSSSVPVASTTPGTVSVDTSTASVVGLAMATTSGGCSMVLITSTGTTAFGYTKSLGANCTGTVALAGPTQAAPTYVTPAGAPTYVTATPGNGQVSVSWAAPTSGPSPVSYSVISSPSGLTCTATAPTTTCTVAGLSNGTIYTFIVIAIAASGAGTSSAASAAVTPTGSATTTTLPTTTTTLSTTPAAPTITAANVSSPYGPQDEANVSVTPSSSTGGSALSTLTVTVTPGLKTCSVTNPTAGTSNQCFVTGLTPGTTYTFSATVTNSAGQTSPASSTVSATLPTVPGAPTAVTAGASSGSTAVSWLAPSSNGGASISSYTVTSSPGALTCIATTLTNCTVTGLTDGTAYTFSVTATNMMGVGAASTPSAPTAFVIAPSAPLSPSAIAGNAQAVVSWQTPSVTGGYGISLYNVVASPGNLTCSTPNTSCTITGLTNGTSYTFTITAVNSAGSGPGATTSSVIPSTTPSAPTGLTATPGTNQVTLSWTAPDSGGLPISIYTVTATPGNFTCTTATTSCTISGLTSGTTYTFSVTATNNNGTGSASSPVSATPLTATPPGAPGTPTATAGSSSALVNNWTAAAANGSTINLYTVTATDSTTPANGGETCQATSNTTGCTVTGLTPGDSYTFKVTATSNAGTGVASGASNAVTPYTTPGTPTSVVGIPAAGQVSVAWTPGSTGFATNTYAIQYSSNGGSTWTTATSSATASPYVVTGLANNTSYIFEVQATNAAGSSAWSAPSTAVTTAAVPGAPGTPTATAGASSALVNNWTAAAANGSTINLYTVTATDTTTSANGGETCQATSNTAGCTVTGLTPGDSYTFTVSATNTVGTGISSAASNAVTPYTTPGVPTNLTVTMQPVSPASTPSAVVSWSQPSSGFATNTYTLQYSSDNVTWTTLTSTIATSYTVSLSTGYGYYFRVLATNLAGSSSYVSTPSAIVATTLTSAPQNVTATANAANQLYVTWSPPALLGGSVGPNYAVYRATSPYTTWTKVSGIYGTMGYTGYTDSGLTAGTAYEYEVVANDAAGSSAYSAASAPVTAAALPGAPTAINATPVATVAVGGTPQMTVTWSPGATGYASNTFTVQYSADNVNWTTATTTATSSPYTVTSGLTTGTPYYFRVAASNSAGTSAYLATTSTIRATTQPGTPTNVTESIASGGQVYLTWSAPVNLGGWTGVNYYVEYATSPYTSWTVINSAYGTMGSTYYTTGGLTAGTTYEFQVAASAGAYSSPTAPITIATTPGAPTAVTVTNPTTTASVTAASTTGSVVTYTAANSFYAGETVSISGLSPLSYDLNNVTIASATSTSFTVNSSVPSGTATGTGTATPGGNQLVVSWTAPSSNGYSPITSYTLTFASGSTGTACTTSTTSCIVTGLSVGTQGATSYSFTATATNAAGTSAAFAASNTLSPNISYEAVIVGGGGGGNSSSTYYTGGGGGGISIVSGYLTAGAANSATVGAGGAASTTTGSTGGTSYLNSYSVVGGTGGSTTAGGKSGTPTSTSLTTLNTGGTGTKLGGGGCGGATTTATAGAGWQVSTFAPLVGYTATTLFCYGGSGNNGTKYTTPGSGGTAAAGTAGTVFLIIYTGTGGYTGTYAQVSGTWTASTTGVAAGYTLYTQTSAGAGSIRF